MKFEITKEVIQGLIELFGKEAAIKQLQEMVNVLIIEVVDETMNPSSNN
jgi:hypothetical protein